MARIKPIPIVIVMGAALLGCAKTQTHTSESADTSPNAAATSDESPAKEATTADPNPAAARSVPDIRATCRLDVKRQINCKDVYIPMIVDTRIKLDFPSGTAARGKDQAGRDELVAIAMQEFPEYYSVEKIPTICEKRQAMVEKMPPAMLEELGAIGSDCLAERDCEGWTSCIAPVVERILAMEANAGAR